MKKCIRLTALILLLVMTVGLACGCSSSEDENQIVYANLTIGLPHDLDSEVLEQVKTMIGSIEAEDGYAFLEDAIVKIVTVPQEGTEEYKDFIKQVYNNKIDLFLGNFSEEMITLVEDKKITSTPDLTKASSLFTDPQIPSHENLARAYNRRGYSIPFYGSYQGVFMNVDVFEKAEIDLPTDWATLNDAIAKLKEKNIVPFVAGFADGAGYWLDEMIMSEGGIAEHSAIPSKGVVGSWQRAVSDIKKFYNDGAFNSDVLTATHDAAVQQFINKDAAMIVCSSKDLGASVDGETVKFMTMPVTPTGLKKDNAFIGKSEMGFFINSKSLMADVDDVTKLCSKITTLLSDYFGSYEYYPEIFDVDGYYPFYKDTGDITMDTAMEKDAWEIISKNNGDIPMENYLLSFDEMESGLVDVLENEVSITDYLTSVTKSHVDAQAELDALNEKKK